MFLRKSHDINTQISRSKTCIRHCNQETGICVLWDEFDRQPVMTQRWWWWHLVLAEWICMLPWVSVADEMRVCESSVDRCWNRDVATSICLFGCTSRQYDGMPHRGHPLLLDVCIQLLNNTQCSVVTYQKTAQHWYEISKQSLPKWSWITARPDTAH